MNKLAVVYYFKENLNGISSLREKYDPNWHMISPHITLVSPISDFPEIMLIEHVMKVTARIKPFFIHLTGLTKTQDNCLFLLVKEGSEDIIRLHDKLYSTVLSPYIPVDFPFVPHITLGDFGTKNTKLCENALIEAQKLKIDKKETFDTISIIKGDGTSPVITVKTISLHS